MRDSEAVKRTNAAYELLMAMEPEERVEFINFFCSECGGSDGFHEYRCESSAPLFHETTVAI